MGLEVEFFVAMSACVWQCAHGLKKLTIESILQRHTISKVIKMFVVEKTPPEALVSGRVTYPFQQMELGDSFFINNYRKAESARIAAFQFCKRHANEWKFTMRKMDGGWRLIRIN